MQRSCSQERRPSGSFEPYDQPNDYSRGGMTLRCAGVCDEDIAMCFCPTNTTFGRYPAAQYSIPGTNPFRAGRPMGHDCQPNKAREPGLLNLSWETIIVDTAGV